MQRARLRQHFVDGRLDRLFFCDVGFEGEELVRVFGGEGGEVVTWGADVEGVDFGGAVGEAAVCYAETDACGFI